MIKIAIKDNCQECIHQYEGYQKSREVKMNAIVFIIEWYVNHMIKINEYIKKPN